MKVAIIGGGVGGMSLALSLVAAGFDDVDVYESAAAIKALGNYVAYVLWDNTKDQPTVVYIKRT